MDAEMTSTQYLYPKATRRTGFWSRRTGLEKILLAVIGVCGIGLVATAGLILMGRNNGNPVTPYKVFEKFSAQQGEVCTTPECAVAAGEIIQTMDFTADPCNDFYQFACGGWMEDNVIPESKSKWGRFYELRDDVDKAVRKAVEAPLAESDPEAVKNLKNMYKGCLDTATIDNLGYADVFDFLGDGDHSLYGGWPMIQSAWDESKFVWEGFDGVVRRYVGDGFLVSSFVYMDNFNVSHNALYVDQPSLGLPRDMFIDPDSYADYVAAYKTYIVDVARVMQREVGSGEVGNEAALIAAAEDIFAFEKRIAEISVADEDRRNMTEMYNPMTVAELKQTYSAINWDAYFQAVTLETDVTIDDSELVIVQEPGYLEALQLFVEQVQIAEKNVIANYMCWRAVMSMTGDGPTELVDIAFKFIRTLYGIPAKPPRWNTCVSKSSSDFTGFGMAVAHEYIREHFDEVAKQEADSMVDDLRVAFKELVDENNWMDEPTKTNAKEKANLMLQLIGYPDWLPDDQQLDHYFDGVETPNVATHMANIQMLKRWNSKEEIESLRETPERNIWLASPAIVNAWYSPNHNSITFPAGILQAPFFGKGYPRYLNYGAIGVVIGHEITHGFDDQGSQYDGTGNAANWWSPATGAAFVKQVQCIIDQYGNYSVPELTDVLGEDAHVNGKNTQGENVADNGGLHESLRAYRKSVDAQGREQLLPGLQQFSAEQMFFVSYSQVWCEKSSKGALLNQILSDPHSPGKFRVWGPLSNSEDFVQAFQCPVGANMNRAEKCRVW